MQQVSGFTYRRYGSIYETKDICLVPAFKDVSYLATNDVFFFDKNKRAIDELNQRIKQLDKTLDMYELSVYYMGLDNKSVPRFVSAKSGTRLYTVINETWNYAFGLSVLSTATHLSSRFAKSLYLSGLPVDTPYFGANEEGYWQPNSLLDIPPFLNNIRFSNSSRTGFINQYSPDVFSPDCDMLWSPCAVDTEYAYMYDISHKEWFKCNREEYGGIILMVVL